MQGHTRLRKKRLKESGWKVEREWMDVKRYRLVLTKHGEGQVTVEASTRPRAFYHAEQELLRKGRD